MTLESQIPEERTTSNESQATNVLPASLESHTLEAETESIKSRSLAGKHGFPIRKPQPKSGPAIKALFLLIVFALGFGGGFFTGRQSMLMASVATAATNIKMPQMEEINPSAGKTLPAVFGDIGPEMMKTGAIDLPRFSEIYKQAGNPLSDEQLAILTKGG